ncbi:MAG: efflux RND transporter periplasmic adaptor subunit [Planctomycetota bacterium]|nr:efflux RND transporter periplasmic adaptor subunit [Planctomycetota bacterium]MDI6787290.1 efflux RND transporter periplasmic adaptor subunit [Planctomycetota bacterium]
MKKLIIIGSIILLTVIIWWGVKWFSGANNHIIYRLAKVEKGDVIQTVNATGIVQPIKLVQVSTQVTGPIKRLYADFNSRVRESEVVAQIDPAVYETKVAQNKANLSRSIAEVERVNANLTQAEKELARAKELAKRDLISQSELDVAIANYASISAQLKVALASVEQNKSILQMSEVDLAYTTIKSPVDGVVISRNVNEGQTVVGSMSAQTIFIIATDLRQIQIEASIPEADIGKIKDRQPVIFTVDAYPEIEFSGVVTQVRLSATTVQNVVTYAVIISAENHKGILFPGMTANLTLEVNRRTDVLKVPNAALRFTPDASLVEEGGGAEPVTASSETDFSGSSIDRQHSGISPTDLSPDVTSGGSLSLTGSRRNPDSIGMSEGQAESRPIPTSPLLVEQRQGGRKPVGKTSLRRGKIWVQTDRFTSLTTRKKLLRPIQVIIGISDGSFTEVINTELKERQEIVTGILEKEESKGKINPFMPQRLGLGRR